MSVRRSTSLDKTTQVIHPESPKTARVALSNRPWSPRKIIPEGGRPALRSLAWKTQEVSDFRNPVVFMEESGIL